MKKCHIILSAVAICAVGPLVGTSYAELVTDLETVMTGARIGGGGGSSLPNGLSFASNPSGGYTIYRSAQPIGLMQILPSYEGFVSWRYTSDINVANNQSGFYSIGPK